VTRGADSLGARPGSPPSTAARADAAGPPRRDRRPGSAPARDTSGAWKAGISPDSAGADEAAGFFDPEELALDAVGVPTAPAQARAIFGAATPAAEHYARLLAGPGVVRGLIGPREVPRLWERHLLNSAAVAELVPRPCSLVDLGSGAGLPGIVLALLLPDVGVTLLEPMLRRVAFLEECVRTLGLENARVLRGRAEDLAGRLAADVVTARAVAPLDRLAALALGLVRPGGIVLAIKGSTAQQEVEAARAALRRLGVRDVDVLRAGSGRVDPAATVVRLTAGPVRLPGGDGAAGRGAR
jgi:16S rRNA (guanine527-N7)-methyltransferase